jgi:hypothetical protein
MLLFRHISAGLAGCFSGGAAEDEPTIFREPVCLEVSLSFTTIHSAGSFFGDAEAHWGLSGDVTALQRAPCRGVCILNVEDFYTFIVRECCGRS